jgi:hypothetical protein
MKLYSFGDSFTQGCCQDNPNLFVKKNYTDYIAEANSIDIVYNTGKLAYSYTDIFRVLTQHLHLIDSGDIVLLAGTSPIRTSIPWYNQSNIENKGTLLGLPTGFIFNESKLQSAIKDQSRVYNHNLTYEQSTSIVHTMKDYYVNVCADYSDAYQNNWNTYLEGYLKHFQKLNIKFWYWDSSQWNVGKHYKCSCHHWNDEYHKIFSKKLIELMNKTPNGGTFKKSII